MPVAYVNIKNYYYYVDDFYYSLSWVLIIGNIEYNITN